MSLLLSAGCDTELACDTGLTGWQLAAKLKRTHVLELMPHTTVAANGAASGGGGVPTQHVRHKGRARTVSGGKGGRRHKGAGAVNAPLLGHQNGQELVRSVVL